MGLFQLWFMSSKYKFDEILYTEKRRLVTQNSAYDMT